MKKLFFTLVVVLTAQLGTAQSTFKDDVIKFLQISGSNAQMDVAKKQILGMIPEAKHAEFNKEFDATMPSFYDKVAEVYMKEYTHDDLKQMIKFYESPIGKKISAKAGTIYEQSMLVGQEWGMELQGILMKYMQ
ncbi:MAG: DUF2059 domain-containing protein [Flavobacteriaceae bacterium]|jgi:hypothetical protein|nr:DUF2059 domain-containing protein [Flavobacteriaceae bacterium]HTO35496.1 DUF2059 domain-containing protein [Flavobacterium sp.]